MKVGGKSENFLASDEQQPLQPLLESMRMYESFRQNNREFEQISSTLDPVWLGVTENGKYFTFLDLKHTLTLGCGVQETTHSFESSTLLPCMLFKYGSDEFCFGDNGYTSCF